MTFKLLFNKIYDIVFYSMFEFLDSKNIFDLHIKLLN